MIPRFLLAICINTTINKRCILNIAFIVNRDDNKDVFKIHLLETEGVIGMLSAKTIEIVKSTAPILEMRGKEITTTFYRNLFVKHPELLNIFNHANQEKGRQQTALANTVTAAAHYIDKLEVLLPAVKQIAHKHRSLAIKPEHYPIVGENLLEAIKEVLGGSATDEIIHAWAEAYGAIADVFIAVEKEMYEEVQEAAGGWADYKDFIVIDKVLESENITSIVLKPADGKALPEFKPGQYMTIRITIPGEQYVMNRQYSLTCSPNREYYRISVKKELLENSPDGKVSNYLHTHLKVGDRLEATVPAGDFTLNVMESEPVYFIAGGVGITPFMSMLHTLSERNPERKAVLKHAVKKEQVQPFKEELKQLAQNLSNFEAMFYMSDDKRKMTFEDLQGLDPNGIYYVCGPAGFMSFAVSSLREAGISEARIHHEFFGPAMQLEESK